MHLAQFLQYLSKLVKPINDILKKSNQLQKLSKISRLLSYAKGKAAGKYKSPDIQIFWMSEHTNNFVLIKKLIVQSQVLCLPDSTGNFLLECDSSAKHVGSVLNQLQNGNRKVVVFFSAVMLEVAFRYSCS